MAEAAVAFELDLDEASSAEQDIGQALLKEATDELVEEAKPIVQARYEAFVAGLPKEVKSHNPDIAEELKDTWMKGNYFTTLRNFMHEKNNAFRSDINLEVFSDSDKQTAKELHMKLQRADEIPVQEAVTAAFSKYCEGLDDVQRQAIRADEAMQSTLMSCRLPNHYVSILTVYINFEKNKFQPHACAASASLADTLESMSLS